MEVRGAGGPLELGGRDRRAVLARLLMARGAVVPVDRLIDDVYHGQHPTTAIIALQECVAHLRDLFEPGTLVSLAPGYALRTSSVDVYEFERRVRRACSVPDLDDALAMWRGTPYADVAGEPWAAAEVERLEELLLSTREQRLSMLLRQGDAAATITELRELTAAHPYRERLWCLLAIALHRCGRRDDALYVVRLACDVISDELEVEPGHDLRRLEAEIRLDTASPDLPTPRAELAPPVRSADPRDPFVGRWSELGDLGRLADIAESGTPRLAVVAGPPGIGKSRLLGAAASALGRRGWWVAWASCLDGGPVLHPWRRLLRGADDQQPLFDLPAELGGIPAPTPQLAGALRPLLAEPPPTGAALGHAAGGEAPPPREDARHAMFAAVTEHLETLAEIRPLLIVLDDIHWADLATLDLLRHVAGSARGPILFAVTTEDAEPVPAPRPPLGVPNAERLQVGGLSPDEVEALAAAMGVRLAPGTLEKIYAGTSGNPFFVRAILRGVTADDPDGSALAALSDGVAGAVRRGIGWLPQTVRATLDAAAVLGTGIDAELIAEVGGLPVPVVREALDLGVVTGMFTGEPGTGLRFGHELLRLPLYADIDPAERVRMHRAALHALASRPATSPTELARHAFAAVPGGAERAESGLAESVAVRWASAAAREAESRLAHADAARWWARAASAAATPAAAAELVLHQIRAEIAGGGYEAARDTWRWALVLATDAGDPVLTARVLTGLDAPAVWSRPPRRTTEPNLVARLEQGLAALPYGDSAVRCRMYSRLAAELYGVAPADRCDSLAAEARAMARRLGEPRLIASVENDLLAPACQAGGLGFGLAEADRPVRELIELADREGLLGHALAFRLALIPLLAERYDLATADHLDEECAGLLPRAVAPGAGFLHLLWRSTRAILDGRPHEFRLAPGEPAEPHVFSPPHSGAGVALVHRVLAAYHEGRVEDIAPLLDGLPGDAWPEFAGCMRALCAGEPPPPPGTGAMDWSWLSMTCFRAEAQAASGDPSGAAPLFSALLPYADRLATGHGVLPAGPVGYYVARLAALLDRKDDADAYVKDTLERCEQAGLPLWTARVRALATPI
ncbi:DNA-binding SARP family transcriptional activator [Thermocatellispora tengchongensis]|uniref:DNA-binding SARP family transcriptional activator n=1 Tax=Thermocatellispora tengchongensis TaxID=1073253 RepID=A0A840PHL0_9ACTN|nr:BTAD domain-containing putative transcriptional regulator [Thermocatellispora tengchongensis]MBB5138326.1 DNA-binding SARP family transcriptional activator [Thermocatellispora tengchongensis]